MNYILTDLCKNLGIEIPKGSSFLEGNYFYKAFPKNDIKPLWNGSESNSFVIGLLVNGVPLIYPFETSEFTGKLANETI